MKKNKALEQIAEDRQKIIKTWEDSGYLAFDTTPSDLEMSMSMALLAMKESNAKSDCREESGIAIGLIDGIIANLRVLRKHYQDVIKDDKSVQEALKDLKSDEDLTWLIK